MSPHPLERIAFVMLPVLTMALAFSLGLLLLNRTHKETMLAAAPLATVETREERPFPEVTLTAKAAFVYDISEDRVLYQRSADLPLPLASITKLMTSLVAYETLPEEKRIALFSQDDTPEHTLLTMPDMLSYLLVSSKNDEAERVALSAGSALAGGSGDRGAVLDMEATRAFFVEAMNRKAHQVGMQNTRFLNPTGLDENDELSGGYGSARDVGHLLAYLVKQKLPYLEATAQLQYITRTHTGEVVETRNTNESIGNIPGLMLSKTGFTDLAGGNLAIVFDAGLARPIAVVVLGSTLTGRFEDTEALVEATLQKVGEST